MRAEVVLLKDIISFLKSKDVTFEVIANEDVVVTGFSSLKRYKKGSMTWIKRNESVTEDVDLDIIELAIVQKNVDIKCKNMIITNESKSVFFLLIEEFFSERRKECFIGQNTVIGSNVILGKDVRIGHNCVIEGNIIIGDNTVIGNNCVIVNSVKIGCDCIVQSQVVIGEDGFGYFEEENNVKKMIKHYGGVIIGDFVFVGNHVNIARGTIDDTIIEAGVKIAPSTHIGHNNFIGKNSTVICSNLFGTVEIGENAYIVASTVRNQCSIGKNTVVGMGSVVTKNIAADQVVIGSPAKQLVKGKK